MNTTRWISVFVGLAFLFIVSNALAEVPVTMQFQGYLTDAEGEPLSGVHTLFFTLYDAEQSGNPVWTETLSAALVEGAFTAILGSTNPLDANVFDGAPLWLGVTVDDGEELSPRSAVASVPYSTRAGVADDVVGAIHPSSVTIDGTTVIDESGTWVGDPTGLQGPQGDKGDPGDQGLKGDKGDKGDPGDSAVSWSADPIDCPTGGVGFQIGENEPQFVCNGAQGLQGPQGDKGDPGDQGLKGDKGDKGDPGDSVKSWSADPMDCPTGGVGFQIGENEPQFVCNGAQGLQGPKGDTGETGAKGETGDQGLQGEKGDPGEQGLKGDKGDTGDQGLKGDKGDKGDAGMDGVHCWDLDENGACDLVTEDKNGDTACDVDDCYSAAYADLSADGRLDFSDDDDLVTKGQADSNYDQSDALAAALEKIDRLEAASAYPDDVVAVGPNLWQKTSTGGAMSYASAGTHCSNLVLAGFDDWRLPTVSELRSLIRGCAAIQTGGSCGVTDGCLGYGCWSSVCSSCVSGGGPDGGCYWPSPIEGTCSWYWSSPVEDVDGYAWVVSFNDGFVDYFSTFYYVRCVR
jgi:hypothetical protein